MNASGFFPFLSYKDKIRPKLGLKMYFSGRIERVRRGRYEGKLRICNMYVSAVLCDSERTEVKLPKKVQDSIYQISVLIHFDFAMMIVET